MMRFPRSLSTAWKQQIRTVINGLFYNVSLRKQEFLQTFVTCPNSNFLFSLFLFFFSSAYARGCRSAAATGGRAWAGPGFPQLQTAGDQPSAGGTVRTSVNLKHACTQVCVCVCVCLCLFVLLTKVTVCPRSWFLFIYWTDCIFWKLKLSCYFSCTLNRTRKGINHPLRSKISSRSSSIGSIKVFTWSLFSPIEPSIRLQTDYLVACKRSQCWLINSVLIVNDIKNL